MFRPPLYPGHSRLDSSLSICCSPSSTRHVKEELVVAPGCVTHLLWLSIPDLQLWQVRVFQPHGVILKIESVNVGKALCKC